MRNFWRGELPIPNSTEYAIETLYTEGIRISSIFIVSAVKYDCFKATDSSVCRIVLLGFAIRVGTPVNMKEGDNQRDQGEGLPPLSLSLRFSPSWLPLSLPILLPRWGVGGTRKTTRTLYILSIQGRLTLHVRRLVHIS